jgi:hypothetical protein
VEEAGLATGLTQADNVLQNSLRHERSTISVYLTLYTEKCEVHITYFFQETKVTPQLVMDDIRSPTANR